MPQFNNDAELEAFLIIQLKSIVDEVAKDMLKELQGLIQSEVYDAGDPKVYQRLEMVGGLLGSFDKDDANISGRDVQSTISQDPMSMVNDPDRYIHGSHEWIMSDIRELLTDIIIKGESGPKFGKTGFWMEPRDFWSPFIKLIEDGTCDKYIQLEAAKIGLTLQKI